MMQSLKKLIGTARSTEARSVDVAAALDQARLEIAEAKNQRAVAEQAYADGLLHLDDGALKALIEARQEAMIRHDRAELLVSTLEQKLVATREAEAVAALTAERDAAEREAAAVADLVRVEYPKLAATLVSLLQRLEAADKQAGIVNEKLTEAGRRGDIVRDVQARALPDAGQYHPGHSIWNGTLLKEIPGFAPGWDCER
ncbi:hypothetical protein U8607_24115 [Methylobacterium durans]|uniref:hypothetical protein n=1 Tax=Methylobacterium durans TaxID=2202825 RepID=UPI002AFE4523|nr:hypothetical protein [Methylobacterium durans]MEA1835176.1 hypothetical protein [Methylobacterium durans]